MAKSKVQALDDKIRELSSKAAELPADECQEHILNLCYIALDSCNEEAKLLYKVAKAKYDYAMEEIGDLRETHIILSLAVGDYEKGFTTSQAQQIIDSGEYELKDCRVERIQQFM